MPRIIFENRSGEHVEIDVEIGTSVLEAARAACVDLEGACEGSLACSTCHVIVQEEFYDLLPAAEEAEEDMLDLAFGLTKTSRLGCQIIVTNDMDGIRFKLP